MAAEGAVGVVMLKSLDDHVLEMSVKAAKLSSIIGFVMDDGCADGIIPLPNVASDALAVAIAYCEKHAGDDDDPISSGAAAAKGALEGWDEELVGGLEQRPLFDLMRAAHYLDIAGLLHLTCTKVADMMKGKTPEQIRNMFNIDNDFTEEEEDAIRKELALGGDA